MNISRITRGFKLSIPLATPTPRTPPTSVCVVEIGIRNLDARTIVVAAAKSAEKPRVGVNSVIFLLMVSITLHFYVHKPITMPMPPSPKIQTGTGVWPPSAFAPPFTMETIAASGPIALATSLAPWAKAMKQALII